MSENESRGKVVNVALLSAIVLIWAAILVGVWVSRKPTASAAPAPAGAPAATDPAPDQKAAPTNPPPASGEILNG
jgi:flagellar basal body-associated protein FliL